MSKTRGPPGIEMSVVTHIDTGGARPYITPRCSEPQKELRLGLLKISLVVHESAWGRRISRPSEEPL